MTRTDTVMSANLPAVAWTPVSPSPAMDAVDAALGLVDGAFPRCGRTVVVAVDGRSGTGKTTYAALLAEGLDAPVIHLDDIYPGWDGLEAAVTSVARDVLEPLAAGGPAAYTRWDWMRDRPGRVVPVPTTPVLIVEGVGAGAAPAGRWASVLLWLTADDVVRKERAIRRDGEVFARQWDRWAAQEVQLLARDDTQRRATLVLDTTSWVEEGSADD